MDVRWFDIKNPPVAGRTSTSSLLHDERHGSRFVEQTQLSVLIVCCARIAKDASVDEHIMHIGRQRTNVAGV